MDAIQLTSKLITFKSVTPEEDGIFDYITDLLTSNSFKVEVVTFEEPGFAPIKNIYAEIGDGAKNLAFAGHLDVVPIGDKAAWTVGPFSGEIKDGKLYGRGASDMKSGVAAWICAAIRASKELKDFKISLLLTGDEESVAINGTQKLLKWMEQKGYKMSACLVGEPTSESVLGDTIKIGRRGSATFEIEARGVQGHVAYPHLAKNPVHMLTEAIVALKKIKLDDGTSDFQASNLECVNIEVGNKAANVIPAKAKAMVNIRHNTLHSAESLHKLLQDKCAQVDSEISVKRTDSSDAFLTKDLALANILSDIVKEVASVEAKLSTAGGTSDARFVQKYCPVAELGVLNATAHKVDENVVAEDIALLSEIYYKLIIRYFI